MAGHNSIPKLAQDQHTSASFLEAHLCWSSLTVWQPGSFSALQASNQCRCASLQLELGRSGVADESVNLCSDSFLSWTASGHRVSHHDAWRRRHFIFIFRVILGWSCGPLLTGLRWECWVSMVADQQWRSAHSCWQCVHAAPPACESKPVSHGWYWCYCHPTAVDTAICEPQGRIVQGSLMHASRAERGRTTFSFMQQEHRVDEPLHRRKNLTRQ